MRTVRRCLTGQVLVLAALAATAGLTPLGWLAGCAHALSLGALLHRAGPAAGLGPADRVTLGRAWLVGGVTALAVSGPGGPWLVGLGAVALVLDRLDGEVARRTGTASAFGARFDMEVDAFLLLVLGVAVGGWAVAIGALRYAYVAAGQLLPWLPGPLPPRYWRKVVAGLQGVALLVALAGIHPAAVTAAALALLVESFGRDVVWRWRHRADLPGGPDSLVPDSLVPAPRSGADPVPATG